MNINPKSTDWTGEEKETTLTVLEKLGYCQDRGGLPPEVFERLVQIKKNISTEYVIFNEKGELYLRRRPSLRENPSEPFPGQLHGLGVTHGKNEYLGDTFDRLNRCELGNRLFRNVAEVSPLVEVKDPQRGIYLCRIFVGQADNLPKDKNQGYYKIEEIPWGEVIQSHRDTIIPRAAAYRRFLVETGIW